MFEYSRHISLREGIKIYRDNSFAAVFVSPSKLSLRAITCNTVLLWVSNTMIDFPLIPWLNSSLVMSLGAGAWRVSGWPHTTSREEVSKATLEAGTTPKVATNQHRHTEKKKISVEILTREKTYLKNYIRNHQPPGREGGEGARIRNASPKRNNWSATISLSKATMQYNFSYKSPKRPSNSPKVHPVCHVLQ